jgi:UDP-N-acetylmuramate dehydrogenase
MMAVAGTSTALIDRLPPVRGRLTANAPLGQRTWFRVGGPAEVLFRPADDHDLEDFLRHTPQDIPVTVIGVASNLLVRDGGIPGVTIRLGREFAHITTDSKVHKVSVGAGALDYNVSLAAAEAEIAGLEFLSGVPGTIGGGLRMNAGAYGCEIKDVLVHVHAIDRTGEFRTPDVGELELSYRHCGAPLDWIFLEAVLQGAPGTRATITSRLAEIQAAREASQPIRARTGGSTFANPPEKHTNFLINTGNATAADIEGLGEEVRRRVHAQFGVVLEWEIRRIGRHGAEAAHG